MERGYSFLTQMILKIIYFGLKIFAPKLAQIVFEIARRYMNFMQFLIENEAS